MPLLEHQRQWLQSMYQTNGLSAGMRAYQRNFLGNHGNALTLTYPRTSALLGHASFRFYAQQYLCRFPVRSGDLNDYGQHFYQLLQEADDLQAPWLADLALVEWTLMQSLLAADDVIDRVLLPAQKDCLQTHAVSLSRACRLLRLRYPAHELLGRDDSVAPITLAARAGSVLFYRHDDEIHWRELSPAEACFVEAFGGHRQMVALLSVTLQHFPEFLPKDILMFLLGNGLLIREETL